MKLVFESDNQIRKVGVSAIANPESDCSRLVWTVFQVVNDQRGLGSPVYVQPGFIPLHLDPDLRPFASH